MQEHPRDEEDMDLEAAPEGAAEEARPDEDDVGDPDAEQQDPESGPAAS